MPEALCLFFHCLFFFFFFSFSLLSVFWSHRSSVGAFVPSYVFSSDQSFTGSIARLPSRSIVPSFDRLCDHSFAGLIICSPVRSYPRLSVYFFVWLVDLFSFSSPLLYSPSVLLIRSFSFLLLIVLSLV